MAKHLDTTCPYCGLAMRPAVMRCGVCDVEVRGTFRQTSFQMLPPEDQRFLEQYLLAGFSIKELESRSGMGYAAIRSRLDKLIAKYQRLQAGEEEKRRLLQMVSEGEITAAEAAERIRRITDPGSQHERKQS